MKIDINKNGFVSGEYIDIKADVSNRKKVKSAFALLSTNELLKSRSTI